MRCALTLVVAAGIVVVQVETETESFVGIDGKFSVDVVLTVLLITTVVITDIGIGRQRI